MPNFLSDRAEAHRSSGGSGKLFTFKMEDTGKKYHVKFLSQHFVKIGLHYETAQAPYYCNKQYFAKDDQDATCEYCEKPNLKYPNRPNTPQLVLLGIGYVVQLLGAKVPDKDYDDDPVKLISIPAGKGQINLKHINEGRDDGDIMDKFWVFEKDVKAGYVAPMPVDEKKVPKFDRTGLDGVLAEWGARTELEVDALLIAGFRNILWTHPDFVSNGLINPYPEGAGGPAAEPDNTPAGTESLD